MATFVPFAILRMIPAVEAGAVAHLDGLRERGAAAMTRVPKTAASHALHEGLGALGDARLMAQTAGGGGGGGGGAAAGAMGGAAGGDGGEEAGLDVPMAKGDPESNRMYEDEVARLTAEGVTPRDKGPKPVLDLPNTEPDPGSGTEAAAAGSTAAAASRPAATPGAEPWRRQGPGPETAEDAWKWEGVPQGRGLLGPVRAGEPRFYMGDDGHGPQIVGLDRAWPPGDNRTWPPSEGTDS
jgi:hypothetical protein